MAPNMGMAGRMAAAVLAVVLTSCAEADDSPDEAETTEPTASPTPGAPLDLWAAPDNPEELARQAEVRFEVIEHLKYHVHAHLDVFVDGQPVQVPPGIGIDIENPSVQAFSGPLGPGYGGIEPPGCFTECISELHTHDPDGVIHTESRTAETHTLGQFFVEWDVELSDSCVGEYCAEETEIAVYVDGEAFEGDPNAIEILNEREIAIVIGSPPDRIPDSYVFSAL